jgi:carbon storage regulator
MLVLSRKVNESIVIADVVTVTVVAIHGDKVRIGISAPTEIPIHRQEVWDAIQREALRQQQPTAPVPPLYAHQAYIDARRVDSPDVVERGDGGIPHEGESPLVDPV